MTYNTIKDFHEIAASPRKQMDRYLGEGKRLFSPFRITRLMR